MLFKKDFNKFAHGLQKSMLEHAMGFGELNGAKLDYSNESINELDRVFLKSLQSSTKRVLKHASNWKKQMLFGASPTASVFIWSSVSNENMPKENGQKKILLAVIMSGAFR